jgi:hypothetical protein
MNILYINRQSAWGETGYAMKTRGHTIVPRNGCIDALETIPNGSFDAVLIEDENENDLLDFIIEAHHLQPKLPIFVANDWGPDLLTAIEEFGQFAKALHR